VSERRIGDPLVGLGYAYGGPLGSAVMRGEPEDFRVSELPSFTPSGDGEHLLARVRKRALTTEAAAGMLARALGVRRSMVSFAGMKDKWALTEQWFSIHLPGSDAKLPLGEIAPNCWVLEVTRNSRKLRRGALAGNRFQLRLRELDAPAARLSARLAMISRFGVPNYFGEQRFGRDGDNVELALAYFAGRYRPRDGHVRGILLSAARSWLFNQTLAARLESGSWGRLCAGDLAILDGRGSLFPVPEVTDELQRRCAALEIHPSGPLAGIGGLAPQGSPGALESDVLAWAPELVAGLERSRVEAARRALRLRVADLHWSFPQPGEMVLGFSLPAGAYATAVVRELVSVSGA
jgi:tRNA pseudouridine13 synthase